MGDTTIFHTTGGAELFRTTENNKSLGNAVTFVTDDNLKSFNSTVAEFKSNGSDLTEACGVNYLRGMGESYDTKSAFALVDGNAKKLYT